VPGQQRRGASDIPNVEAGCERSGRPAPGRRTCAEADSGARRHRGQVRSRRRSCGRLPTPSSDRCGAPDRMPAAGAATAAEVRAGGVDAVDALTGRLDWRPGPNRRDDRPAQPITPGPPWVTTAATDRGRSVSRVGARASREATDVAPGLARRVEAARRVAEDTGAPLADLLGRLEADARGAARARASGAAPASGAPATGCSWPANLGRSRPGRRERLDRLDRPERGRPPDLLD
jgi:hypothetical protein